jgi:tryptophanyl-tRNA synthetase
LEPIRKKYFELLSDIPELDRLLAIGAEQAAAIANNKLTDMKSKMGLVIPTI